MIYHDPAYLGRWSGAFQQTEWALAKKHLSLEVREILRKTAFAVVADIPLGIKQTGKSSVGNTMWASAELSAVFGAKGLEIAEECRDLGLQVKDFRDTFYIA